MENCSSCDLKQMVDELNQGQELTRQLEANLNQPSAIEFCKSLAQKILSSYEKAISIAKSGESESKQLRACPKAGTDSSRSPSGSPTSDNSDRPFKDHERREKFKKRKTLPKWSAQFQVGSGGGVEGPLDDGYSWRKYGQKDILGAKYPRGYYRCTHRNSRGCLATKQVQRSEQNPSIFDVTYWGTHTCLHRPQLVPSASVTQEYNLQSQNQDNSHVIDQQQHHQDQHLLLSFQTSLKVKTEGLDLDNQELISSSFSFPSTPINSVKPENHSFPSLSVLDNHFMGSFSPTFVSPATSESNYYSLSPCQMSGYGGGTNLQTSESDFTDIIPTATSATNSPMLDIDFALQQVEFDPNFPFDAYNFFP